MWTEGSSEDPGGGQEVVDHDMMTTQQPTRMVAGGKLIGYTKSPHGDHAGKLS